MAASSRPPVLALAGLVLLALVSLGPGSVKGHKLGLLLQKREAPAPAKTNVAADEHKAKEFLGGRKRAKRQLEEFSGLSDWEFSERIIEMNLRSEQGSSDYGLYGADAAISAWNVQSSKSGAEEFIHDEHEANLREREQESFWPGVDSNYDDYY